MSLLELRQRNAHISYSQLGEDLVLAHYMQHRDGFYVDVGCHDPFTYSTTALFHLHRGWRGINIDADPDAIAKFRLARPGDINLHCGVSDAPGELEFTIFEGRAHNTFDPRLAQASAKRMKVQRSVKVPVRPLRDILAEHLPAGQRIDYLNIDCEGLDEKVVLGNDWLRFSPAYVSLDIHGLRLSRAHEHPLVRMLGESGYKLKSHCVLTAIFGLD